jgi:hypothetical protein
VPKISAANTAAFAPDRSALDDEINEPIDEDREPWFYLYYDSRLDAFAAAEAADLLGLSWRLASQWNEIGDVAIQQWVIEILLENTLPEAAAGLVGRDVE